MTGHDWPWRALQGRHAMVSFANPSQIDICAELCQSFALDNGAFTIWKTGGKYDPKDFYEWVSKWAQHPGCDWYLIPDVIDGTEADNVAMRALWRELCAGTRLFGYGVPVWHLHESLESLSVLCRSYERVGLGSSGQFAEVGTSAWWHRMSEAMDVICKDGSPIAKLHGLRMLDPTVFSHLPLSSADSTSVARNVGIDVAWNGSFAPRSRMTRALIMMDRIEAHASAAKWCETNGVQRNLELIG